MVHPEDLPAAVKAAVRSGELPRSEASSTEAFLSERLSSRKAWFSEGSAYRLEEAVIGADGQEYRPDRVVLYPEGSVDIVDYKFGKPEDHYTKQVQRYMRLYTAMGYPAVRGYLWYVFPDEINQVTL